MLACPLLSSPCPFIRLKLQRLAQSARVSRDYESAHVYTLEEYGLSRAWIRERLGDVLAAYGFDG